MISFISDSVAFILAMRKMYLTKGSTYIFYAGIKFKSFKQLPKIASVFFCHLLKLISMLFLLKIFYFTVWGKVKIEQIKIQ